MPVAPLPIASAGVVGAGTMGTGIAIAFATAGIPVVVVEPNDEQIERAKQMVFGMFAHQVQRGRLTQEEAWRLGQSIRFENGYAELAQADIVIEAVFENMDVKKAVFAQLDLICKPGAILASNTSTLDIDALAATTKRPERVLGLHFFVPANIMKLLEIVRGTATSPETIDGRRAGKNVAQGGRRRRTPSASSATGCSSTRRAPRSLAEEGVPPERIDRAMKDFGMAMGPLVMFDLSGIDVFWRIEQGNPAAPGIVDRFYREGTGQKTGAGIYRYEKESREAIPDPVALEPTRDEARKA